MSTSTTRMIKTSHLPPRNPALSPNSAPMPTDIAAAKIPASSDTRAPQTRRASMSRPTWSVPSGWSPDWNGDNSRIDVSNASGSAMGSSGARMAAKATSAMITAPQNGVWLCHAVVHQRRHALGRA